MKQASRHILISDLSHELPYSKGLMASSIMATGLAPARAYLVAERIEERMHEAGVTSLSGDELVEMARKVLIDEVGERYADAFTRWQVLNRLEQPLIILVGGATGVGKSTISTQLASRLGITRIIPTDAIREVMRSMFSEELFPTLHTSSFDAERLVRQPLPRSADPLLIGFREQVSAVAVGVRALVARAVTENTDLIVEGAHLVPGFYDLDEFGDKAVIVPLIVSVDDEELHRSHFTMRAHEVRSRPAEHYLEFFGNIRKIQRYVKSLALEHGVPVVASYNLDSTLSQVIELVTTRALAVVPASDVETKPEMSTNGSKKNSREKQ